MRKLAVAALAVFSCSAAHAQNSSATGVGISKSSSNSAAAAVAISGQGGNSSLVVNNPAQPAVSTLNQNVNTSGTSTIKNVPTVFAPGLAAAGLETCLGSVSAGVGVVGTGVSFGTTIPDPGCAARLDARTLWSMGLRKAAVARLCLNADIAKSMPEICYQYQPAGPAPLILSTNPSGSIELIDGRTGLNRMCDKYDAARQKCRQWQGEPVHRHVRIATVKKPAEEPKPEAKPE
jgi:hypothetical protein